jgi:hypothetical protein
MQANLAKLAIGDGNIIKVNITIVDFDQAIDAAQQRRLSGPGCSDQTYDLMQINR